MDAKAAAAQQSEDLNQSDFATVRDFERASDPQPACRDREDDGIENRFVRRIERTIDKNALIAKRGRQEL